MIMGISLTCIRNHKHVVSGGKDIPSIVTDILKNGASLAIISRNSCKAIYDRALYYFKAVNPKTGEKESIIKMVRYDEVVNETKTKHFKRIRSWSKFDYADMILFDDELRNDVVKKELGIGFQQCSSQEGLTWEIYLKGIEHWRRTR
ncbi:hypothetical protein D9758_016200 [Tetrapyrgos nigripes]|uniref:Uncharacterized protein n=1 Tax=Tetrapyrgos nigripes TaxID=182062 RepID=A0A8H5C5P9_9AGAR|nr:hypothetical protein D9758_016200 [Tetrapyrgos nigripes]